MANVSSEAEGILEDAITLLKSRAALAFAEMKEKAHRELVKSAADADAYRRERDAKTTELHSVQRELQALKVEMESMREKVERTDSALKRQREFTETARHEAQQWKDQVSRQQESHSNEQAEALQEIKDWKDQYRRAEKERVRTAVKLEEMMTTSRHRTPNHSRPIFEQSTSTYSSRIKAASVAYRYDDDLSPTAISEDERQRSHKRRRKQSTERPRTESRRVSSKQDHHAHHARTPNPEVSEDDVGADDHPDLPVRKQAAGDKPHKKAASIRPPELVRRVHAVVSIPVKEEDDDDQYALGVESAGLFDTGGTPPHPDDAPNESTRHYAKFAPSRTKSGRIVRKVPPPVHSGRASVPAYVEVDDASVQSSDDDNTYDHDYDEQQTRGRKRGRQSEGRRSHSTTRKQRPGTAAVEDDPLLLRSISEEEATQRGPRTKRISRSRPASKARR